MGNAQADDYSFFDADTHMCFLGLAGVKGSNWVLGQVRNRRPTPFDWVDRRRPKQQLGVREQRLLRACS